MSPSAGATPTSTTTGIDATIECRRSAPSTPIGLTVGPRAQRPQHIPRSPKFTEPMTAEAKVGQTGPKAAQRTLPGIRNVP